MTEQQAIAYAVLAMRDAGISEARVTLVANYMIARIRTQSVEECKTMAHSTQIKWIESELERVGVGSDLDASASIVCNAVDEDDEDFGTHEIRLADDWAQWSGAVAVASNRLSALPDGAGWEAFWEAFRD